MLQFRQAAEMASTPNVRPSPIAGAWYPGKPEALAQSVDAMLAEAPPPELQGEILGLTQGAFRGFEAPFRP